MSVLIVGSVALDDIKTTTAEHRDLLGGSASYASVAASFYTPVSMVGIVGDDFPEVHRDTFRNRGINIDGLEVVQGKTFRWSGEYEEDMNNRRTLSVELNVFEHFSPKIPTRSRQTPYVLLANIAPSLQAHVLDQVEAPKFVVADTMDLWISLARPDLLALIKRVDMLILNDSEARQFTGERNAVKAGRKILELGPRYVVVKKGEHGALLFSRDNFFATGAFPLEDIADPTGAGDCFAGALIGYLAKTDDISFESIKKAVIQGTLAASFNVEAFSLKRLERLTREEIDIRHGEFSRYISVNGAH
ncbi:sugar kinase [Verrucomicrobia bacterium LW23]|nr:sugar kinase [Verrucomicrobia bacterium LW23]